VAAAAWLGLAVAGPAAFAAMNVPPPVHHPVHVPVHPVVMGGMPGWQIALIATGSARALTAGDRSFPPVLARMCHGCGRPTQSLAHGSGGRRLDPLSKSF
jgi:hypothetical protein